METITLTISDETLRDGQQQVGLFFDTEVEYELAFRIARTGVQQMALMPAVHASEASLVQRLIAEGLGHQVIASTMLNREAIAQSLACGAQQIILFHAVSDRLLALRDPELRRHPDYRHKILDDGIPDALLDQAREAMLKKVLQHLQYAKDQGLQICFAAEDASRTDIDFLVDCIRKFEPYIDHFLLCDTVGILTPETTRRWMADLLDQTHHARLAVHFHNDMGMALENTIQAVCAGACGISGTFSGIGERAGNVALEQVLQGLKWRFGWEVEGIDYDALHAVTDYLDALGARAHTPYSPAAQRHESGVHVNSLLRDRQSYCIFPYVEPEIWFGKCSGVSNLQSLFENQSEGTQSPLTRQQYEQLRTQLKTWAIAQKRSFSAAEVLALIDQGVLKL